MLRNALAIYAVGPLFHSAVGDVESELEEQFLQVENVGGRVIMRNESLNNA